MIIIPVKDGESIDRALKKFKKKKKSNKGKNYMARGIKKAISRMQRGRDKRK